ncbi:MAG: hypothetical protein ACYTEL_01795, partial [Planctomycetota bacterium]
RLFDVNSAQKRTPITPQKSLSFLLTPSGAPETPLAHLNASLEKALAPLKTSLKTPLAPPKTPFARLKASPRAPLKPARTRVHGPEIHIYQEKTEEKKFLD